MIKEISNLEEKIQKMHKNGNLRNIRTAFDIGVDFGIAIANNNIKNYEFEFWKKYEENKKIEIQKSVVISKINSFICLLMKKSISAYISKHGGWYISVKSHSGIYKQFDQEIIEKYSLRILNISMSEDDDEFEIILESYGILRKLFMDNGLREKILISIPDEDGENSLELYNMEDLNNIQIGIANNKFNSNMWDISKFNYFYENMTKGYMLSVIK